MRMTELLSKTRRESPKDADNISTALLTRGGYIDKLMAGVYSYLPLGLRVITKIEQIIREEMEAIGGQEIFMPALTPKELWEETGRWKEAEDIIFKIKGESGKEMGLAFSHEEVVTGIAKQFIQSYRDLPKAVWQFQTKFRNEPRAKSGLLRGREFLMKDLYSFHDSAEDMESYYDKVTEAYKKIFKRTDIEVKVTEAGGGTFSKSFSHEFQSLIEVGEDKIIYCPKGDFAQNIEIAQVKAGEKCPKCGERLVMGKGVEVGNIFKLGTRYSEALGFNFVDKDGKLKPVVMASYGIGLGRLMGTIAETHHDEMGLIWPKSVAPFDVHLIDLGTGEGEKLEKDLTDGGTEVLFDDREMSAGEKFADADLIGIPVRVVVSKRTLDSGSVEVRLRKEKDGQMINREKLGEYLNKK